MRGGGWVKGELCTLPGKSHSLGGFSNMWGGGAGHQVLSHALKAWSTTLATRTGVGSEWQRAADSQLLVVLLRKHERGLVGCSHTESLASALCF